VEGRDEWMAPVFFIFVLKTLLTSPSPFSYSYARWGWVIGVHTTDATIRNVYTTVQYTSIEGGGKKEGRKEGRKGGHGGDRQGCSKAVHSIVIMYWSVLSLFVKILFWEFLNGLHPTTPNHILPHPLPP